MDEAKLGEIEARAKSAQSGPWLVCAAEDAADGLSRVRSPEGLNLESRRMGSLEAHPKFLRFVRERGLS